MERPGPPPAIAGDLDDPWVAALADALPGDAARLPCPGDLPDAWPEAALAAPVVVLHRPIPTDLDAGRLHRLRQRPGGPPRVVLVIGSHARFHQVRRWEPLVDLILPEATAAETIGRHLAGPSPRYRGVGAIPTVAAVAVGFELRQVLAEVCRQAGYPAVAVRDWAEVPPTAGLAVWDVPLLEDGWDATLRHESGQRPVVALLGFADRESVACARAAGAAACLDLPCDPADLAWVLDRIAAAPQRRLDPAHAVPPRRNSRSEPSRFRR